MAKGIDWDAIETEYVTSGISLRDLAKKWEMPYPTVRDHGKKHGWVEKRSAQRTNIVSKTLQKFEATRVEEILDDMESIKRISRNLVEAQVKMSDAMAQHTGLMPKDLVDAERALAARLENFKNIYGVSEDNHIIIEVGPKLRELSQ